MEEEKGLLPPGPEFTCFGENATGSFWASRRMFSCCCILCKARRLGCRSSPCCMSRAVIFLAGATTRLYSSTLFRSTAATTSSPCACSFSYSKPCLHCHKHALLVFRRMFSCHLVVSFPSLFVSRSHWSTSRVLSRGSHTRGSSQEVRSKLLRAYGVLQQLD